MRPHRFSRLDLTPLIGVLLVLLVVVLIVQPLPKVGADVAQNPGDLVRINPKPRLKPVFVYISRSGAVSVDGQPSSLDGLVADVAARRSGLAKQSPGVEQPTFGVYVDADNDTPYDEVFQAYATLERGGFKVAYAQRYLDERPRER